VLPPPASRQAQPCSFGGASRVIPVGALTLPESLEARMKHRIDPENRLCVQSPAGGRGEPQSADSSLQQDPTYRCCV